MTVWKSPVLYFGILLVVAVTGLLAAPFIVNWNSYRGDLEAYGRQLTGRKVEIMGDISVRLFPWPRLTADDVRIGNASGLEAPHFATAQRIVVRMTLAGLARGGIDVQSVEIDKPSVRLERLATGEGNWTFSPSEDLLQSHLLSRVSLDSIVVRGATVQFADRRRGELHQLDDVEAQISAPGVAGPWRVKSMASYRGRRLDLGFSTGVWKPDEPFRVGFRVAQADGSGAVFTFDGDVSGGRAEGAVRLEPAATSEGKGDAEGGLRPLVFSSRVKADFDAIAFDGIEIGPRDPKEGGAITTGVAQLTLGRRITARADMTASMLDLDQLAGARSRALLREAGSLAVAGQLFDLMPAELSLSGSLKVTALKVGGETLDMVNLAVAADQDKIEISELSAGLPGRSKVLFHGKLFPAANGPELDGTLALESNDLRQLAFWASPELRDAAAARWTGSRGRFKLQTGVEATLSRFRLTDARYELDGDAGAGEVVLSSGGRNAVDVRLDAKRVDIDSFVTAGFPALSPGGGAGLAGLFALALPKSGAPDVRLTLQAGELLLNGVKASDVALDLASGSNGFDLRTLEIGSVGGARVEAMGLILDTGRGADGSIDLDVKARDPEELLRLVGVVRGDAAPAWSQGLGQTDIKANLGVKPSDKGPSVSVTVDGTVDEMTIRGSGNVEADQTISAQVAIDSANSGRLARLAGLQSAAIEESPGRIDLKMAGTASDGFMADIAAQLYGARLAYNGTFDPTAAGYGLDGRVTLRTTDIRPAVAAIGLPLPDVADNVLTVDAALKFADGHYALDGIDGRIGASPVHGTATATPEGVVSAHIDAGRLALQDLLTTAFLDWTGTGPDLDSAFRTGFPLGFTGEVWLKPAALSISGPFEARDAEIGVTARDGEVRLALFGKDADGRATQVELASLGQGQLRRIEGRVSLPVDLGQQLALAGGQPVASGEGVVEASFTGEGRSPGGVLAALKGSGSYKFESFTLAGLSPGAFTAALAGAKDAAGITAAFDRLRGGEGLPFGKAAGTIAISNGEVTFQPLAVSTADADVTVAATGELGLGELSAEVKLMLKARPGLPGMTVTYGGPPMALGRSEDNTELATTLGVTLMQEGVSELERLQAEQRKLALQEERQRIEDEARLQAYYAQRDELLLRRRELKVHAEMRVLAAEVLRQKIEAERAANAEISSSGLKQRQRELRVQRRMAKLAAAAPKPVVAPDEPLPLPPAPDPAPVPAPKAKPQSAAPARQNPLKATTDGGFIIDQPPGAPVVSSDSPSAPPSQ